MHRPLNDLTQDDTGSGALQSVVGLVPVLLMSVVISLILAYGVYLLLDRFYPEDASVATLSLLGAEGQPASVEAQRAIEQRVGSQALREQLARHLLQVRPEWFTHDHVDDVARTLGQGLSSHLDTDQAQLIIQFSSAPPIRVQHVLEAVILTLEGESSQSGVAIRVLEPPSEPLRIAPRMMPLVPILMILFMPLLPGLILLQRALTRPAKRQPQELAG